MTPTASTVSDRPPATAPAAVPVAPARRRPRRSPARAGDARRGRSRAYVALTKPRIVELLLVTTVPAMMLAAGGLPPLVAGRRRAGRRLARGRRGQRAQLLHRPRHRPGDEAHLAPPAADAHRVAARRAGLRPGARRWCRSALMAAFTNWLATGADRRPRSSTTTWSTRCGSSGPRRTTRSGAASAARLPVLIGWAAVTGGAGRAGLGAVRASSSSGSRRTSTRWPSSSRTTTPGPASRCCRWWRRRAGSASRVVIYAWLTVVASLALCGRSGMSPVYGVTALVVGALFVRRGAPVGWAGSGGASRRARCACSTGRSRYLTILFVAVAVDALI